MSCPNVRHYQWTGFSRLCLWHQERRGVNSWVLLWLYMVSSMSWTVSKCLLVRCHECHHWLFAMRLSMIQPIPSRSWVLSEFDPELFFEVRDYVGGGRPTPLKIWWRLGGWYSLFPESITICWYSTGSVKIWDSRIIPESWDRKEQVVVPHHVQTDQVVDSWRHQEKTIPLCHVVHELTNRTYGEQKWWVVIVKDQ